MNLISSFPSLKGFDDRKRLPSRPGIGGRSVLRIRRAENNRVRHLSSPAFHTTMFVACGSNGTRGLFSIHCQ
jgi:hypothetical protein